VTTSYEKIQIRRGSSVDFDQVNPVLKDGEPAFTIDDSILKIGDGITPWNELGAIGGTGGNYILRYSYLLNATPAIEAHSSFILTVDAPSVLESKRYSIITSPSRAFYDGMVIAYAYVSADNQISIVLTNGHSKNIPFDNDSLVINTAIILMDENAVLIDGPNILDPSIPTTTTTSTTLSPPTAIPPAVTINLIRQFSSGSPIYIFLNPIDQGVIDYFIEFSTNAGSTWTNINHTPGIQLSGSFPYLSVDNPIYGATYSFRARAQNSIGIGNYGPTVTFTTLTTTAGPATTSGPTTTTTTTTASGNTTTTTTTTSIPSRAITFAAYGRRTLTYTHPLYNSTSTLDTGTVNVGTGSNPSYYGTYDQDGNVYELIEDFNDGPDSLFNPNQTRIALGGDVFSENGFERVGTDNVYFNKIPKGVVPIKPISNTINLSNNINDYFGLRLVRNTEPPSAELSSWCKVANILNPVDQFTGTVPRNSRVYGTPSGGSYLNDKVSYYLNTRASSTNPSNRIGSVGYDYWIKKVPVTYSEFVTYLNLVDRNGVYFLNLRYCIIGMQQFGANLIVPTETNHDTGRRVPHGNYLLYDAGRAVGNRYYVNAYHSNKPVYSLNWTHAARYCNWIHNGKGSADTENGAYDLRRNEELTYHITRQSAEIAAIPTLNEWHKAAYYNPITATYYNFATQSNRLPQACSQNISTGNGIIGLTQNSIYVHYPI